MAASSEIVWANGLLRRDLGGELEGCWIGIDPAELTMGLLEDLYGADPKQLIDSVSACLADGDLPHGVSRDGLRALTRSQFAEISNAVAEAYRVPKAS